MLADRLPHPALLFAALQDSTDGLVSQATDDRARKNVRCRRGSREQTELRWRQRCHKKKSSERLAPRVNRHLWIGPHGEYRRDPGAIDRHLFLMATARTIRLEQRLALRDQRIIDRPDVARPGWRLELCDVLLELVQAGEIRRVVAEVDQQIERRLAIRFEIGEHAEHLTGVARERLDEEPIRHAAIPLRAILA